MTSSQTSHLNHVLWMFKKSHPTEQLVMCSESLRIGVTDVSQLMAAMLKSKNINCIMIKTFIFGLLDAVYCIVLLFVVLLLLTYKTVTLSRLTHHWSTGCCLIKPLVHCICLLFIRANAKPYWTLKPMADEATLIPTTWVVEFAIVLFREFLWQTIFEWLSLYTCI